MMTTNPEIRTSERHRPISRLTFWHTVDYDQEVLLDLSYCNKTMKDASLLSHALNKDMVINDFRSCSTSTPLRSPNFVTQNRFNEMCVAKQFAGFCNSEGSDNRKQDNASHLCLYPLDCLNENEPLPCRSLEFDSAGSSSESDSEDLVFLPKDTHTKSAPENIANICEISDIKQTVSDSPVDSSSQASQSINTDSGYISHQFSSIEPSYNDTNFLKNELLKRDNELTHVSKQKGTTTPPPSADYNVKSHLLKGLDAKQQVAQKIDSFLIKALPYLKPKSKELQIGWNVGEEKLDIVKELNLKNVYPALRTICSYLNGKDLNVFHKVSEDWKQVLVNDCKVKSRWLSYLRTTRTPTTSKENQPRSPKKLERGLSDAKEGPLTSLQVAATPSRLQLSPVKNTASQPLTRSQAFIQAASKLRFDESLRPCPLCLSPARTRAVEERAECANPRCLYDFCVKCRNPFHGAEPCRSTVAKKTKTEASVATKKSKKNLRRL